MPFSAQHKWSPIFKCRERVSLQSEVARETREMTRITFELRSGKSSLTSWARRQY
jgi:hypothetical protein